ncbi:MAG: DUF4143 domain-containing protein [Candidatus Sericytochromatia bacterium]|uniref:DUF4143 domain-containing protein n=1 Tax=Candidatus Tanganyikabacteria bacterium TaxID=2961651 RepID=A0A937X690_9BACT|nr:DUF4143 domain-containing protein [Candidatus Tanganyikabacteria bacterium]
MIRTYLERDLAVLGFRIPAPQLRRFWQMLAHLQGQTWNGARLASSLGVGEPAVKHYRDILEDTFMLRVLPPYFANLGKRLVKSPKVYVRDSGLVHALLGLDSMEDILGHPVAGASWEGWALEQLLAHVPERWQKSFFRTHAGAEVDLILERPGNTAPIAVKFKLSADPTPRKGFWTTMADVGASAGVIVCQGNEIYPLRDNVFVVPVPFLHEVDWSSL